MQEAVGEVHGARPDLHRKPWGMQVAHVTKGVLGGGCRHGIAGMQDVHEPAHASSMPCPPDVPHACLARHCKAKPSHDQPNSNSPPQPTSTTSHRPFTPSHPAQVRFAVHALHPDVRLGALIVRRIAWVHLRQWHGGGCTWRTGNWHMAKDALAHGGGGTGTWRTGHCCCGRQAWAACGSSKQQACGSATGHVVRMAAGAGTATPLPRAGSAAIRPCPAQPCLDARVDNGHPALVVLVQLVHKALQGVWSGHAREGAHP